MVNVGGKERPATSQIASLLNHPPIGRPGWTRERAVAPGMRPPGTKVSETRSPVKRPRSSSRRQTRALRYFAHEAGVDLAGCSAYGDDEPMLTLVGLPVAARPTPALAEIAHARSWRTRNSGPDTGLAIVNPAGSQRRSNGRRSPRDRRGPSGAARQSRQRATPGRHRDALEVSAAQDAVGMPP